MPFPFALSCKKQTNRQQATVYCITSYARSSLDVITDQMKTEKKRKMTQRKGTLNIGAGTAREFFAFTTSLYSTLLKSTERECTRLHVTSRL